MKKLNLLISFLFLIILTYGQQGQPGNGARLYAGSSGVSESRVNTIVDNSIQVLVDSLKKGGAGADNSFMYGNNEMVILNPYKFTYDSTYKGQLHCHSRYSAVTNQGSDGEWSKDSVALIYRQQGYRFLSITDHNDPGHALTTSPSNPGLLYIQGSECDANAAMTHINAINITKLTTTSQIQTLFNEINLDGGIPVYNHPKLGDYYTPTTFSQLPLTGPYLQDMFTQGVNTENFWDAALNKYKTVFGIAVDDYHNNTEGYFNTGWIVIHANTLSIATVMDALRTGNFYSSTGANVTVSVNKRDVIATTDSLSTIEFIGKGGTILQTISSAKVDTYSIVGDEKYVRVRITRDFDSKKAWSNPVFISPVPANYLANVAMTDSVQSPWKEKFMTFVNKNDFVSWLTFTGTYKDVMTYHRSLFRCLSHYYLCTVDVANDYLSWDYATLGKYPKVGDIIRFVSGTLPGATPALVANRAYFVAAIKPGLDGIKISNSPSGTVAGQLDPIDLTSTGTSVYYKVQRNGYADSLVQSGTTITIYVASDTTIRISDNTFALSSDKVYDFEWYYNSQTGNNDLTADANNPQGERRLDCKQGYYLLPINAALGTAASGSNAACTWNVYEGAVAKFDATHIPSFGTSKVLSNKRPQLNFVNKKSDLSVRILSVGGDTNKPKYLQLQMYLVPVFKYAIP